MGHIQYFLQYTDKPINYRDGANPGFHEAVADIASLSFQTPEHLHTIGLIPNLPSGNEGDINFLFQMALDKVAFLPFGYLVDQLRWSVYRGETTRDNYNRAWWDLREMLQMGSARPWGEAMLKLTNGTPGETDRLDAGPLLAYFKPLQDWLTQQNTAAGEEVGWDKNSCPPGSFVDPTPASGETGSAASNIQYLPTIYVVTSLIFFAQRLFY